MNAHGRQVHFLKGTKTMVIRAFDGTLYCSVDDKDIYVLDEIPAHEAKSKNLDADYEKPKYRKRYIPPMNHPWRSKEFWRFVKAQEHHWMDNVSA